MYTEISPAIFTSDILISFQPPFIKSKKANVFNKPLLLTYKLTSELNHLLYLVSLHTNISKPFLVITSNTKSNIIIKYTYNFLILDLKL